jgi:hypothetical protein
VAALVPQTSFAAGELAPTLWSQFQQALYAQGLRRCENFFISPHGAAVSRPGSLVVTEDDAPLLVNNVFIGNTPVRLLAFRYSDDTAYLLAFVETDFGAGLDVIRDGVKVHGLVSPFHTAGGLDLTKMKHAQVGANLYLTHPEIAPQVLTYGGTDTAWAFTDLAFDGVATVGEPFLADPPPDGTSTKPMQWKITTLIEYPSGLILETTPVTLTRRCDFDAGFAPGALPTDKYDPLPGDGHWAEIRWIILSLPADPGYRILSWRLYRGFGKVFGLVPNGEKDFTYDTDFDANAMIDWGEATDDTITPPNGTNPFKVYSTDGANTLVRTEKPSTVTFFGDRCFFGGTAERPYTVWASALGNYQDFDTRYTSVPDMSVQYALAVRSYQEIRSIIGQGSMMIILTDGGVHALAGANNGALDATQDPTFYAINEVGANWRDPLLTGNALLYARARGGGVQALQFSAEGGGYQSADLSFLTSHMFNGHEIVGWAHARVPWDLVLAVRDDGKILALQYGNGKIPGWAIWDTDGTFEDVCVVPEGDEDAIYVTTRRGNYRYIERMASRVISDVADAVCVDNAVTYEGSATTTPAVWTHLVGKTVYGVADGFAVGPLTVSPSGGVTLSAAAEKVTLGLRYVPELETLDLAAGRNREKNVKRVFVDVESSRGLKAGESTDSLSPWRQRDAGDGFTASPLSSETVEVRIASTWNRGGRVVIRQEDATPLTVTGLTREVEPGGT